MTYGVLSLLTDEFDFNGTIKHVAVPECGNSSATAYFWYRNALDITPSIGESGGIKWWMLLCLLGAWIIVYLCVMRGIQSTGKVTEALAHKLTYVTSTLNLASWANSPSEEVASCSY